MWLINVHTLGLEYHHGAFEAEATQSYEASVRLWEEHRIGARPQAPVRSKLTPPYAILSHTWGEEELTFQQFRALKLDQIGPVHTTKGLRKIMGTCNQAKKDGLQYAWIDTCCIDKSSSAELQEAINSMFLWYAESSECYALLEDVDSGNDQGQSTLEDEVTSSRWLTRGWTLQEMIAPSKLTFFRRDWSPIGRREDFGHCLVAKTRIDAQVLCRPELPPPDPRKLELNLSRPRKARAIMAVLSRFSAAQRISWAAL